MKPMSLIACGIVVSSIGMASPVHAGSQMGNFALQSNAGPETQAWRNQPVRGSQVSEPTPRGDLRGDIANNARVRPESDRSAHLRRR